MDSCNRSFRVRSSRRHGLRLARCHGQPSAEQRGQERIERVTGGQSLPAHLSGAIIALGNFDGFHIGHQAVVGRAVELARQRGVAAIVATFEPHPVSYFRPDTAPFRLTTLDQRQRLFGQAGVDALMVFDFGSALASVSPESFVRDWLVGAGGVVTGDNFSFGQARAGNVELLAHYCDLYGLSCHVADSVTLNGEKVSSSRIRSALRRGDCTTAAGLLTRPIAYEGVLQSGQRADPALPLLDASLELRDYLLPRPGVYAVRARLVDGRSLGGSAYLAPSSPSLELFLIDLSKADLGQRVEIELILHLHDALEKHDPPALRRRIVHDRLEAGRLISVLQ